MSYGFASHLGIAAEATWGTPLAADDYFEAFSESMALDIERFETRNITGRFSEPDDAAGLERSQGEIVLMGHPVSMGYFLKGAFGQSTVTSIAAELQQSEFTPRQSDISSLNPMPPWTLEIFRAGTLVDTAFQYAGVNFASIQLAAAPNQDLRVTANAIAKNLLPLEKTVPTFPTSPIQPFLWDTASVSLDGVGRVDFEALAITLNNNMEGIPALNGTQEIAKIRRTGPPTVEITGTTDFTDREDFDRFRAQSEFQLAVNFTQSESFSLLIECPRVVFTGYPVQIPGRERITVDFTAKGRFNVGSNHAIKATLFSTQSF